MVENNNKQKKRKKTNKQEKGHKLHKYKFPEYIFSATIFNHKFPIA